MLSLRSLAVASLVIGGAFLITSLVPLRAAEPTTKVAAPEKPSAEIQRGDTKHAPLRAWDSERDLPGPLASDPAVKVDFPIVYVRVPRPYPKEYFNINHLNQAGLHQTNAPGAELRML